MKLPSSSSCSEFFSPLNSISSSCLKSTTLPLVPRQSEAVLTLLLFFLPLSYLTLHPPPCRISEKDHSKQQERREALREQAELEKKVVSYPGYIPLAPSFSSPPSLSLFSLQEDFHAHQREIEAHHHSNRLALQQQLGKSLADKQTVEQRKRDQERAEEEERKVFLEAKKV